MVLWPFPPSSISTNTSNSSEVAVVASSTAHTKGVWTQVVATIPENVGLRVTIGNTYVNAVDTRSLIDLGIGSAGSEVVVVADLGAGSSASTAGYGQMDYELPISLPAGGTLWARSQSAVTSKLVPVAVAFRAKSSLVGPPLVAMGPTMGVDTATSGGVLVNSVTAWSEIIASTTEDIVGFVKSIQAGSAGVLLTRTGLQIAVGAAGSEQVIDYSEWMSTASEIVGWRFAPIAWCRIPAGSRISARNQISASATAYVHLHGLR